MHFSLKKCLLRSFFTLTVISLNFFLTSVSLANTQEPLNTFVKSRMNALMQQEKIPGAVVLLYHDGKMLAYTFGVEDLTTQKPISLETTFELGSITKTFMTLLLAKEVEAGEVTLSQPLPKPFFSADQISLLELATHTGSLPFNAPKIPYNADSSEEANLFKFLRSWKPAYPIGTVWSYSNLGFGLLGMELQNLNHMTLDALLKKEILAPLQMTHSGLITPPDAEKATGYNKAGNPVSSNDHAGPLAGAWAMKSSGHDMENYLKAATGAVGTPSKISAAMTLAQTAYIESPNTPTKLGLAWVITPLSALNLEALTQVQKTPDFTPRPIKFLKTPAYMPDSLIGKTGATDGFRSYIGVLPDSHDGIVILVNRYTENASPIRQTAIIILLKAAGITPKKSSEDQQTLRKKYHFFF